MSHKFYITVKECTFTSNKLYISKSSDYSDLQEIDLEGRSATHYIAYLGRNIYLANSASIGIFMYTRLKVTRSNLVLSPELIAYLHKNAWFDTFGGIVPPPYQFTSSEPIPDLLKDL